VKIQDEENPGGNNATKVQAFIDANPKAFAEHAKALTVAGEGLIAAARSKDVKVAAKVADGLDQVCETCHMQFWYPAKP